MTVSLARGDARACPAWQLELEARKRLLSYMGLVSNDAHHRLPATRHRTRRRRSGAAAQRSGLYRVRNDQWLPAQYGRFHAIANAYRLVGMASYPCFHPTLDLQPRLMPMREPG